MTFKVMLTDCGSADGSHYSIVQDRITATFFIIRWNDDNTYTIVSNRMALYSDIAAELDRLTG